MRLPGASGIPRRLFAGTRCDENLYLYFPIENQDCHLSAKWLTVDIAPRKVGETLRVFCLEILSEFSRSSRTGKIVRDFVHKIDRKMVQNASDRLWHIYFGKENEAVCLARWMLSLEQSIEILSGPEQKYETQKLPKGKARNNLLDDNRREFQDLISKKQYEKSRAMEQLSSFNGYSLENVLPTSLRNLVILDLIARLMVETAVVHPFDEMWSDEQMLNTFFIHMLYAAPKKVSDPLPFHIGIYSDKLLRDSRCEDDQRDNIERLLKHKFDNVGERYLFQLMLLHYLKQTDSPQDRLKAMIDNPSMAGFVSVDRLTRLKNYL